MAALTPSWKASSGSFTFAPGASAGSASGGTTGGRLKLPAALALPATLGGAEGASPTGSTAELKLCAPLLGGARLPPAAAAASSSASCGSPTSAAAGGAASPASASAGFASPWPLSLPTMRRRKPARPPARAGGSAAIGAAGTPSSPALGVSTCSATAPAPAPSGLKLTLAAPAPSRAELTGVWNAASPPVPKSVGGSGWLATAETAGMARHGHQELVRELGGNTMELHAQQRTWRGRTHTCHRSPGSAYSPSMAVSPPRARLPPASWPTAARARRRRRTTSTPTTTATSATAPTAPPMIA